jgi:hypothetical protein
VDARLVRAAPPLAEDGLRRRQARRLRYVHHRRGESR